jgi:hypothetical protein
VPANQKAITDERAGTSHSSDAYLEWRLTQRAARPFKVTASFSLVFFATKPRPLSRSIRSGFGSPHPEPLANSASVPKSPRRSSFLAHRLSSMTHQQNYFD